MTERKTSKPRIRLDHDVPISQYYLERMGKYGARGSGTSRRNKVVTGNGPKNVYPFAKMKPGDSFLLPLKKVRNPLRTSKAGVASNNYPYEMRSLAKAYGELLHKTFIVLKDDNHQWRCYCTADNARE